jgi:hypothetical protein
MLATREDIFDRYSRDDFEAAFGAWFAIEQVIPGRDAERIMYVMKGRT